MKENKANFNSLNLYLSATFILFVKDNDIACIDRRHTKDRFCDKRKNILSLFN